MAGNKSFPNSTEAQVVSISASGTGDQTIVAGVAGKTVRVLMYVFTLGGTTPTAQLKHGSTVWSGAMAPTPGLAIDHHDCPLVTAAGESFIITLGGTTPTIAGYCVYTQS